MSSRQTDGIAEKPETLHIAQLDWEPYEAMSHSRENAVSVLAQGWEMVSGASSATETCRPALVVDRVGDVRDQRDAGGLGRRGDREPKRRQGGPRAGRQRGAQAAPQAGAGGAVQAGDKPRIRWPMGRRAALRPARTTMW